MRLPIFSLLKVTFSQFGTMFTRFAVLKKSKNIILEFDFLYLLITMYMYELFLFLSDLISFSKK